MHPWAPTNWGCVYGMVEDPRQYFGCNLFLSDCKDLYTHIMTMLVPNHRSVYKVVTTDHDNM